LARELDVVYQTVQVIEKSSSVMKPATEARWIAALTALAKRAAVARDLAKIAELLEQAGVD
jgi:hypothetical protein